MNTNKILKKSAIVQVRMGSSRLPGKALMKISGKPVLWWIMKRISLAKEIDEIIIATTSDKSNDPIEDFVVNGCSFNGFHTDYKMYDKKISLFRYEGREDDVIGRVLAAANHFNTDIICDISGDCIFISPDQIDFLIKELMDKFYDYVSNDVINRSWPDGCDLQIYTKIVLAHTVRKFKPENHVGWNVAQHPDIYRIMHCVAPDKYNLPHVGITLDEPKDLELISVILDKFRHNPNFKIEEVLDWLIENPEILDINNDIVRKDPTIEA